MKYSVDAKLLELGVIGTNTVTGQKIYDNEVHYIGQGRYRFRIPGAPLPGTKFRIPEHKDIPRKSWGLLVSNREIQWQGEDITKDQVEFGELENLFSNELGLKVIVESWNPENGETKGVQMYLEGTLPHLGNRWTYTKGTAYDAIVRSALRDLALTLKPKPVLRIEE